MLGEDAIHGSDRAQIDALVEQAGIDFGGREIDEARPPQHLEDVLLCSASVSARSGFGRARAACGGCFLANSRRCRLARESPSAVQAAAIRPLRGASATAASSESSSFTVGRPSSRAIVFWISMIASARSSRFVRSRLSRCN